MVGKAMTNNNYTLLDTVLCSDGNRRIFRKEYVADWFKHDFESNYLQLTTEEREEGFSIELDYGDLIVKILNEPLQEFLKDSGAAWALKDEYRNPIEEYEHALVHNRDEDLTEEQHAMKIERLRQHKEWFEKQNT